MKSVLTVVLASSPALAAADNINALPNNELPWTKTQEGAEFAALEGDRFTEAYMAMVRLPAGLESPPHTKSAGMFGVVVEGTFVHRASGSTLADTLLGPGSYYHIPAGLPHVSACVSTVPCVAFLYQDGAFDFNVVDQ